MSGGSPISLLRRIWQRFMHPQFLPVLFGVVAASVALLELFVPTAIGLADNGDELRMACRLGVTPDYGASHKLFESFVHFTYHSGAVIKGVNCEYRSSSELPLRFSEALSSFLPGGHALDLRVAGVFYALCFGLGVALLVAALPMRTWIRATAGVVLTLVLGDIAFVAYFSSGYSEPLAFVGLLIVVGLLMQGWRQRDDPRIGWLFATTAMAVAIVLAKPQYGPLALVLGVALVVRPIGGHSQQDRAAARVMPVLCACVVVAGGIFAVATNPADLRKVNRYNSFFAGVLGRSPNPKADLRAFGLPPDLAKYAGTDAFDHPNAVSDPSYVDVPKKVDEYTIGTFYLARPSRALSRMAAGLRSGADPRLGYLGMHPESRGLRPGARVCRLCVASIAGRVLKPATPVLTPLFWLFSVVLSLRALRSSDRDQWALAGGVLLTTTSAVVLFVVAVFGDAVETTKHLWLAVASGWLALILTGLLVVVRVQDRPGSATAGRSEDGEGGDLDDQFTGTTLVAR